MSINIEMSHSARVLVREKIAGRIEAFMNTCHGEDGRFCEEHGVYHGDQNQPTGNDLYMEGLKKRKAAKSKSVTAGAVDALEQEKKEVEALIIKLDKELAPLYELEKRARAVLEGRVL